MQPPRKSTQHIWALMLGVLALIVFPSTPWGQDMALASNSSVTNPTGSQETSASAFLPVSPYMDAADLDDGRRAYRLFLSPNVLRLTRGGLEKVGKDFRLFQDLPRAQFNTQKLSRGYSYSLPTQDGQQFTFFAGNYERAGIKQLSPQPPIFEQKIESNYLQTTFGDTYTGVDVVFKDTQSSRFKEIIIKEPLAYTDKTVDAIFWEEVLVPEGTLVQTKNKQTLKDGDVVIGKHIVLVAPTGQTIQMTPALAYDARGRSYAQMLEQRIKIDEKTGKLSIGYVMPGSLMHSQEVQYPLVIDPRYSVCFDGVYQGYLVGTCGSEDFTLSRSFGSDQKDFYSDSLMLGAKTVVPGFADGWTAHSPVMRFQIDMFRDLPAISRAMLNVKTINTGVPCQQVDAYRMNRQWESDTIDTSIIQNLDVRLDGQQVCGNASNWYGFNVTELVLDFLDNNNFNTGIMLQGNPKWVVPGQKPAWPEQFIELYSSRFGDQNTDTAPHLIIETDNFVPQELPDIALQDPFLVTQFQRQRQINPGEVGRVGLQEEIWVYPRAINVSNLAIGDTTAKLCTSVGPDQNCFANSIAQTPVLNLSPGQMYTPAPLIVPQNHFQDADRYFLHVKLDGNDAVNESNEENNYDSFQIETQNKDDISIEDAFIGFVNQGNNSLEVNGLISASHRLFPAIDMPFGLKLKEVRSGRTIDLQNTGPEVIDFGAGEYQRNVAYTGVTHQPLQLNGYYQILIEIDPNNVVDELREDDNTTWGSNIFYIERQDLCNGCNGVQVQTANFDGDIGGDADEITAGTSPSNPAHYQIYDGASSAYLPKMSDVGQRNYGGDPVNLRTGAFELLEKDFEVAGRGGGLKLVRTYASTVKDRSNRFGYGWHFNYHMYTFFDPFSDSVQVYLGGALATRFTSSDGGQTFDPLPGESATLMWNDDQTQLMYGTLHGSKYFFKPRTSTQLMMIDKIVDRNGNETRFTYTTYRDIPLLSRVIDPSGRYLQFDYNFNDYRYWNKVERVTYSEDEHFEVFYQYDPEGFLLGVTKKRVYENQVQDVFALDDIVTSYGYDMYGRLESYQNAYDTILRNEYDQDNRVIRQYQTVPGSLEELLYTFTYDQACTQLASYTSADEFYTQTTCFDEQGNKMRFQDAVGAIATWEYDVDGMPERFVDPNGNVFVYDYDQKRRKVLEQLPDTQYQTQYEYTYEDDFNQMTQMTVQARDLDSGAEQLKTTIFTIDPENGNTTQVQDPLGGTENFVYDAFGNIVTYIDKRGSVFTRSYDQAGNYQTQESVWVTDASENSFEVVQNWEYDSYGNIARHTDANGNIMHYGYDSSGNKRFMQDSEGGLETWLYNSGELLYLHTNKLGLGTAYQYNKYIENQISRIELRNGQDIDQFQVTQFAYDLQGRLLGQTDANGNQQHYQVDGQGKVISHRDAYLTTTFEYDNNGNLLLMQNDHGNLQIKTYDARNRELSVTDALGNGQNAVQQFVYDGFDRLVRNVDANGQAMTYTYDLLDRKIQQTNALGHVQRFVYDENGNQIGYTDARAVQDNTLQNSQGYSLSQTFDELDRVIRQINADDKHTLMEYDGNGNVTRVIDRMNANGSSADHVTVSEYDGLDRLISSTDAAGAQIMRRYDAAGNIISQIDAMGRETTYAYDMFGRNTRKTDSANHVTTFVYDKNDNLLEVEHPDGTNETFVYDAKDRRVSHTNELGDIYRYVYDAIGNTIQETNRRGMAKNFTYDLRGKLLRVDNAEGGSVVYTYDAKGNKLSQTTDIVVTQYQYDDLDQVTVVVHPGGGQEVLSYDQNGNMVSRIDANDDQIMFVYDALDRMIQKNTPEHVVNYTYDNWDNTLLTSKPDIDVASVFDERNLLVSQTQTYANLPERSFTVGKTYYPDGQLHLLTDPSGKVFWYDYESRGLLDSVRFNNEILLRYTYNTVARPQQIMYGNGVVHHIGHDGARRITSLRMQAPDGFVLWEQSYQYDGEGNRLAMEDRDGNTKLYTYDRVGRLTNINNSLYPQADDIVYSYDTRGNRLTEEIVYAQKQYQYDGATNELVLWQLGHVSHAYAYDQNGSPTRQTVARLGVDALQVDYDWDSQGRLLQVVANRQGLSEFDAAARQLQLDYHYDDQGNRFEQSGLAGTVYSFNDGLHVLAKIDETGVVQQSYAYGLGMIAQINTQGQVTYVHSDVLGSTVMLTDDRGESVADYQYQSFGQIAGFSGSTDTPFTYTGQEHDFETDLLYMNARYLDASMGRFLSRDVLIGDDKSVLSKNRYTYVMNNPFRYVDPSGYEGVDVSEGSLLSLIQVNRNLGSDSPSIWNWNVQRHFSYIDGSKSKIDNTYPVDKSIKEAAFFAEYPMIALKIGSYKREGRNLSSYAGNFAINSKIREGQTGIGSYRNAYRHALWQGIVTREFGTIIAKKAGDAHENNAYSDLKNKVFTNDKKADETVDLLNNIIGRKIGSKSFGASNRQVALQVAQEFYRNGLYVFDKETSPFVIHKAKLTQKEYKNMVQEISILNERGRPH